MKSSVEGRPDSVAEFNIRFKAKLGQLDAISEDEDEDNVKMDLKGKAPMSQYYKKSKRVMEKEMQTDEMAPTEIVVEVVKETRITGNNQKVEFVSKGTQVAAKMIEDATEPEPIYMDDQNN